MKGKVKFYDAIKGYGFIIPDDGSKELFFRASNCTQVFLDADSWANNTVEYETAQGPKGLEAVQVVPIIEIHDGKVKFFDRQKQFGMIHRVDGSEIYFKSDGCELVMPLEAEFAGLPVRFQVMETPKGPMAIHVEPQDRSTYEFDGRNPENFQRYARRHTHALESWADIPLNEVGVPIFLERLARLALKEPWNFKRGAEREGEGYGILWNFIGNTFLRLLRQGRISVATKDNKSYALFNTGLVNELYLPIFIMFRASHRPMDRPWELMSVAIAGSDSEGRLMTSLFSPLPEPASYFERTEDMLLDTKQELHVNYDHAIIDGVRGGRYPYEWVAKNKPKKFEWKDYRSMKTSDRKRYLEQLAEAIRNDADSLYDMSERLKSAKDLAIKRISWNYKTAIPQYYPLHDELSFLIPLSLVNRNIVDIALVVTKNKVSGSYEGRTVFPLEWAYMNARLVCRPDSDWLTTEVSTRETDALDEQE